MEEKARRPSAEYALELLLTHRGDPLAEIEQVLADDPGSVRGHCLRAALIVCTDAIVAKPLLAMSLSAIEAACPDIRNPAHRHAAAARAWLDGDMALAAERYGAILIDWPSDVLALAVAHALDFRLGHRRMLRDRVAKILTGWKVTTPHYASVLAMLAFGLEENGQYRRAEEIARRALALDPRHPGAIHVIAHVMEMQGRAREGLAFLAETEPAWLRGTAFSTHLAWHRALFHLEMDNAQAALTIYDSQIGSARAPSMSVLADGSSLLWRLRLRNIDVGGRWDTLADHWEMHTLAGARPFYVVHAMIAFSAARRSVAAAHVLEALRASAASTSLRPEEALALPFSEALLAFASGDFPASVDWLARVRRFAHRCGGSLAQCDLIHLTFTEAALRAHKNDLACALVAERATRNPTSQLNRQLRLRLLTRVPAIASQSPRWFASCWARIMRTFKSDATEIPLTAARSMIPSDGHFK
jgi:tetratricopeptide (TPR) repeat protein